VSTDPIRQRIIAEGAAEMGLYPNAKIDNEYQQQTYQALLRRGMPAAEAKQKAEWWARLKATDPTGDTVIGPADNPLVRLDQPRIETDPVTGRQTYKGSFQNIQPQTAFSGSSAPVGAPPTMIEYSRNQWFGMDQPIDRFSLNPGQDYFVSIPGPAPTMFAAGDLPVICGTDIDPSVLRWVAWPLRHTAAFSSSRSQVSQLIEVSLEGDAEEFAAQTSVLGGAALSDYFARVGTWVQTLPTEPVGDMTPEDFARFYPDGSSQ
jgi:hypothetical protein